MIFPLFVLEKQIPKIDKIRRTMGFIKKNIIKDPNFYNKFFLNGDNDDEIRDFFDERIRNTILNKFNLEYKYYGFQDCFIVNVNKKMSPHDLMELKDDSIEFLKSIIKEKDKKLGIRG